jgi:hypothetical protein
VLDRCFERTHRVYLPPPVSIFMIALSRILRLLKKRRGGMPKIHGAIL